MAQTNNGKYRRLTLTVNRRVNGSLVTTDGFPKIHNITDAFGAYQAITSNDLETMTDGQYSTRLSAFYTHLEALYDFFNRNNVLNASNGTDAVTCPIDNSEPDPVVVQTFGASLQPIMGGTLDDHLSWFIYIASPAPQDLPYSFRVLISDINGNPLRYEYLNGIIPAGATFHDSANDNNYIYISEVYSSPGFVVVIETDNQSLVI